MLNSPSHSLESRTADGVDPGAVDNRLSLDPGNAQWSEQISDWVDGNTYTITAKVVQISPGEFEVTSIEAEDSEEETESEDESEPMMAGKPNKAVRGMMSESM